MNVLVIGANGMLGQAVMDTWQDVHVLGRDSSEFDITDPVYVRRVMAELRPKVVINCAAYTNVDDCEKNEAMATKVNGTAVGYLAKACADQKATLVHISTDYVFDGLNEDGYREDDIPTTPVNAYGRTKLHGEEQLMRNAERYYLVRTSWLYGPNGNPAPGVDAPMRSKENFVRTMLDLAQTKPELRVVSDQHGKPTYTRDLAAFIKHLVLDRAPYGIYHGVNEEPTTWFDFAKEILTQAGYATPVKPVSSAEFPRPAKRPAWSILLNTKRPLLRPWPEALRDYLSEMGYSA